MLASVDAGQIIATKKFPFYPTDNVESLLQRTYNALLFLFYEIMDFILLGKELPISNEKWSRKAFTRKDFDKLMTIDANSSQEDLEQKIRATIYKNYGPQIILHGHKFKFLANE